MIRQFYKHIQFLIIFSFIAMSGANAQSIITMTEESSGYDASPLTGGDIDKMIFGVLLNKDLNSTSLSDLTVLLDQDPNGILLNPRIIRSTNSTFGDGDDVQADVGTFGTGPNRIDFSAAPLTSFNGATANVDRWFFIVVDIDPNTSTTTLQPSITQTQLAFSSGTPTVTPVTITGSTNYTINAQSVAVTQQSGGVSTSVVANDANKAIIGFSAVTTGNQSLDDIVFTLSVDPTTGPLSGFQLVNNGASSTYSGGGTVLGTVPGLTASTVTFLNVAQALSGSPTYFFLIADVSASGSGSFTTTLTSVTADAGTTSGSGFSEGPTAITSLNTTLNQLTTGIAPSPLGAGATSQAIIGFTLSSNGNQTVSLIKVQLSSDPAGKLGNFVLVRSTDNSFATAGDNSTAVPTGNISISGSGPYFVDIAPAVALDISPTATTNFFLTANVNGAVTSSTPTIKATLSTADITLSPSVITASSINATTTYSFTAAQTSTITLNYGGQGSLTFAEYNNQTATGLTTGNSEKIFGIDVGDSDADTQTTTITSLTLQLGDPANLKTIALFDNATSTIIPGTELNVAANINGSNQITFSGLNYVVPDEGTKTIDVYVTFNSLVIDNDVISVLLFAASASPSGSGLAPLGTIQTAGGNNDINVVSTKLIFNSLPTQSTPATTFAAVVWATDANGILDVDATDQVSVTESGPGPGNITGGGLVSPAAGVYTFGALSINLAGTYNLAADDAGGGQTLTAAAGSILIKSLGVQITDGVSASPLSLSVCYGGSFQPLGNIKIEERDPADFTSGGIFMLQLPSGFVFDTSVNPVLSETGNEITFNVTSHFIGSDVVRISYSVSGISDPILDAITISGLQIRYPSSTVTPGGNILALDASAVQVGNAEIDAQNHGTLTAIQTPSTGFSFKVAAFPGQASILPEETKFSYTTFGVLLKPDSTNPAATNVMFSGNGVSFSSTQNVYVFAPASVGVGNNYDVTYTAINASGCLISVTKTFQVYATSITGLLTEYCINDNTVQTLSVDPARYDISIYYPIWNNLEVYNQYRRVQYNSEAYECLIPNIATVPSNTLFWKKVGYSFTNEYSVSIPSYKTIVSVTNDGAGNVTITSPNHGFTTASTNYISYYVYDASWNVIFSIPYANYAITSVTTNTFTISYLTPGAGTYTNGYGYIYIQNPPVTGVSVVGNVITITVPNHGLPNGSKVQIYLDGISDNGVSTVLYDWYTVANATANTFTITGNGAVSGAWAGYGNVDIFNYRISSFTPSMVKNFNSNFGTITDIYVGFIVNQIGCTINTYNTCNAFIYTNEPVKLNQLAQLDFTGLNSLSSYCASALPVTLTGTETDGSFSGLGITDGGASNNTASFNPASGSITVEVPFNITYSFTDNKNCVSTISKPVTVHSTPIPPTPSQAQFGYCQGDNDRLILKVSGTGTDFSWYNNSSKTILLGNGPVYDASSVGTGSPITQSFFAAQSNLGCESSTAQVDLVINALPIADFSSVGQCAKDTVSFTGPTANIATWNWNFDDGNVSTISNPQNVFIDSKSYLVRLDVTSVLLTGNVVCKNSKTANIFIGFNPDIKVGFKKICDGDNTIFGHISTPPLDSLFWDFGDGITANGKTSSTITGVPNTSGTYGSPVHNFPGYGSFATSVVGKTATGCLDTLTKVVPILIKLNPTSASPYLMKTAKPGSEDGYWLVETTVDSTSTWAFDVPQGLVLNSTDSTWITNPSGNYKSNDVSYVNSPCFDLTGFSRPLISLQYMDDTQKGRDGAVLEYSTDSGIIWNKLGNPNTGLAWYDNNPVNALGNVFGWSENLVNTFQDGYHSLSAIANRSNVRFRIKFASDQDTEGEGFAFNNVNIVEKNRQVLIENFTNTSKTETINHNTIFKNLNSYIPAAEYVPLEYHIVPAGFEDDPINDQNKADNNARAAFYGITQKITSVQDGMLMGTFNALPGLTTLSQNFEDEFNLRSLRSSPVQLDINTSTTADQKLQVDVTVLALENIFSTDPINVYIALVEKIVTDPTLAGQNGETQFKYVFRKMLPNAAGTRMAFPMIMGDLFTASETIALSDKIFSDPTQMAIVAFVQNQEGNKTGRKEIWQSAIELNPVSISSIITGIEPSFANLIAVYPNPSNKELNISLPMKSNKVMPFTFVDGFGREVYSDNFKAGEQTKTVNTSEFAAGIYMLRIQSDKGEVALKKVMVVH